MTVSTFVVMLFNTLNVITYRVLYVFQQMVSLFAVLRLRQMGHYPDGQKEMDAVFAAANTVDVLMWYRPLIGLKLLFGFLTTPSWKAWQYEVFQAGEEALLQPIWPMGSNKTIDVSTVPGQLLLKIVWSQIDLLWELYGHRVPQAERSLPRLETLPGFSQAD